MLMRIVLGAVTAMVTASGAGCGAKGKADTTKEVYTDEEAPKVQVQVVRGVVKEVPWEQVPDAARWLFQLDEAGHYKYRVPIVRVEITGEGCMTNVKRVGLNPKHTLISDSFCNH
jgi:hypothetical protein